MISKSEPRGLSEAKKKLAEIEANIKMFESDYNETEKQVENIRETQREIKESLVIKNREAECVKEFIFIHTGISQELIDFQNELIVARKEAERTDITIKKHIELTAYILKTAEEFQKKCLHQFVLQTVDSYVGSPTQDFMNFQHACRLCVVCGFSEYSISSQSDGCRILCKSKTRLIKRDPRKQKAIGWIHFEEVKKLFIRFIGNQNVTED